MDVTSPKWITRFMEDAFAKGQWSKDPNTKVGAVIVTREGRPLSYGYNGLPRRVRDLPERMSREDREKDLWMCHAEENAISNAAAEGVPLRNSIMFVTHHPCPRCAGMIINAGITGVVIGNGTSSMSERNLSAARIKLREALVSTMGAHLVELEGK